MKTFIIRILAVFGVLGIIAGIIIAYGVMTDYKFTGEQLFAAVNEYRKSHNLSTLEIDSVLCDNLVERYLSIKEPNAGHKGYEEWIKNEGIDTNPKYGVIGELYIKDTSTAQNAVAWWDESPGHKSTLMMKDMKYGCAYANEGTGVVIMATSKNPQ